MIRRCVLIAVLVCAVSTVVLGQDAAEMARKLQDPLANIKALMTDNGIEGKTGQDETSYSFQLQPVYAMPFEDQGFNFILRGVIPILGLAPEAQKPIVGPPLPAGDDHTWGLGDISMQFFFAPRSEAAWKWGVGPMVSLPTRSDSKLAGAGWGGGPAVVLVGSLTENTSLAIVGGHVWGEEEGFSTSSVQPVVYYNVPGLSGVSLNYNNSITYNWDADSSNAWTVPLGLGVSKTIALEGGYGVDVGIGYYHNVEKPDGAADWVIKWGLTIVFP